MNNESELTSQPQVGSSRLLDRLRRLETTLRTELHGADADTVGEAITAIHSLAGYMMTVRLDRRKRVDDDVMCLQTLEWCEGMIERARRIHPEAV